MKNVIRLVHEDYAIKHHITGKNITIAYLDTGITPHNDFLIPQNRILCFKDFVNHRTRPYDDHGHGTHVAGIGSSSKIGIAPASNIISLKVLNRFGNGNCTNLFHSFQWILDHMQQYQIRIVNISIGMDEEYSAKKRKQMTEWVERLWDHGLIICISSGNMGPKEKSITTPGTSYKVITVGSSDDRDHPYSGRGPTADCIMKPDLTAPGTNILSCYSSSHYIERSGTSMATPIVSGAIALYLEKNPASTNKMIKMKLRTSCDDLGLPKNQQGWGRINIKKLLQN